MNPFLIVFLGLLLTVNQSVASFHTPKIFHASGGFFYHETLPNSLASQYSSVTIQLRTSNKRKNSKKAVFILGGGPGFSSWNLEPIQQNIANLGHPVYLMDMLGIGENKFTRPGKVLESWVKQIHQLKSEVSPNHQVILVAHSWGALMAMLYTRNYTDDVAKIILLNPVDPQKKAMENLTDEIHNRNSQEVVVQWDDEQAWENKTKIEQEDIEHITLRQIQQVLPTYFLDYEQGKKYAAQFTVNDFDIDLNIEAWQEYDNNPIQFSEIPLWQKPIHFLECKQDYLMPYNLNAMQPNIKLTSVDIIDQCGHFPWIEQPQTFYELLGHYLNEQI